jgi:hypothetical protein
MPHPQDDTVFTKGKHNKKTWNEVRMLNPEYFMFLANRPAGDVIDYLDYIRYCIDYLTKE